MLNVLKAIRYSVLGALFSVVTTTFSLSVVTFIILNAVILSIAVWNLSIVHFIGLVCKSPAGCGGMPHTNCIARSRNNANRRLPDRRRCLWAVASLSDVRVVVFSSPIADLPISSIFLDVCGTELFVGRVWFELLWIGLFAILHLGALSFCSSNEHTDE